MEMIKITEMTTKVFRKDNQCGITMSGVCLQTDSRASNAKVSPEQKEDLEDHEEKELKKL